MEGLVFDLGVSAVNLAALAGTVLWLKFQAKQTAADIKTMKERIEQLREKVADLDKWAAVLDVKLSGRSDR